MGLWVKNLTVKLGAFEKRVHYFSRVFPDVFPEVPRSFSRGFTQGFSQCSVGVISDGSFGGSVGVRVELGQTRVLWAVLGGWRGRGVTGGPGEGPRIATRRHGHGRRVIEWGEAESSGRECLQPFCPNHDVVIGGVESGWMQYSGVE